jgi:hypothetical protein
LTSEQQSYLSKAQSFPTHFSVPKDSDSQVWGRAKLFAASYPSKPIRILSDSVIANEVVTMANMSSYKFMRTTVADSILIEVHATTTEFSDKLGAVAQDRPSSERDAHLAAYYLVTGEIYPELLVSAR